MSKTITVRLRWTHRHSWGTDRWEISEQTDDPAAVPGLMAVIEQNAFERGWTPPRWWQFWRRHDDKGATVLPCKGIGSIEVERL